MAGLREAGEDRARLRRIAIHLFDQGRQPVELQLVAQERQRVRAKRQLQRSIVFYNLASIGERPQRDRGLDPDAPPYLSKVTRTR